MNVQLHQQPISVFSWLLLALGFASIYAPSFWDLFHGLWKTEQNAHGPIVLAITTWFFIYKSREIAATESFVREPSQIVGWIVLVAGLLIYAAGRSQAVYFLELGSMIPVVAGLVLIFFGRLALKKLWFSLFFMLFMIPLPGSLTDTITQPMKLLVSWGSDNLLYSLGYPISRSGVVLNIGQYRLLVADACAGLNSLFTLEALGLLYLNVVQHSSVVRNVALATLIIPISLTSNLIRVSLLALITYYYGDEAGQGFVHGFSGMLLFLTALLLIIGVDSLLRTGVKVAAKIDGARS